MINSSISSKIVQKFRRWLSCSLNVGICPLIKDLNMLQSMSLALGIKHLSYEFILLANILEKLVTLKMQSSQYYPPKNRKYIAKLHPANLISIGREKLHKSNP